YIGLSFVQRPEDVAEAKALVAGRAWVMVKLEKPQALDNLDAILGLTDAVMLSGETAAGQYPYEAVNMMERIVARVEQDAGWRATMDASRAAPEHSAADAIAAAARQVAHTIGAKAIVAFTDSGSTGLRVARERPEAPVIG